MADQSKAGHGHEGESHGIGRYVAIWLILLFFTIVTVVTGKMDLGSANIYVAMLIASTKATLVVLFFMHLWDEGAVNRLIFVSSIVFALVMLLGIFGDLMTRPHGALPNGGPLAPKLHGHLKVETHHGGGASPGAPGGTEKPPAH